MDVELLFGITVILSTYAAVAFAWQRWMRANLSRRAVNGLAALWVTQLLLFAMHVLISEGRIRGGMAESLRVAADWSLYSEGLDSVPTLFSSAQLALAASLAIWLAMRMRGWAGRLTWLVPGHGLAWLAADELFKIHEARSALVKLYLAGGGVWSLLMLRRLWREQELQARKNLLWVLGGTGLAVAGGVVLDRFSSNTNCVRLRVTLELLPIGCGNIGIMEEMAELLGILCVLAGLSSFLSRMD